MLSLGSLAFTAPWMLGALALLPALWFLLRLIPPAPRRLDFPALRILREVEKREESPERTPLWLLLLRMAIAALIITALAQPVLNPASELPGSGPVALVVDNGWAAAKGWQARVDAMETVLDQAEREGRMVHVLAMARPATGSAPEVRGPMRAGAARSIIQGLEPQPWGADMAGTLAALRALEVPRQAHVLWLSDGRNPQTPEGQRIAGEIYEEMIRLGGGRLMRPAPGQIAHLVTGAEVAAGGIRVDLARAGTGAESTVGLRASGEDGRLITTADASFAAYARETSLLIEVPSELRSEVTRIQIVNEPTAGAVRLMDERWRRRPVGIVGTTALDSAGQPWLNDLYYLSRALEPFSELRSGSIAELLQREISVIFLADIAALSLDEEAALTEWVENGGLLVRFAGPRLADAGGAGMAGIETEGDARALLPVRLRAGDRTLGGALSWSEPAQLAPFQPESPFYGLAIPDDVTVSRQVLAEPALAPENQTWARLEDGTPLVSAAARGDGQIVLIHTTAGPEWSSLSLSGLFVEMLQRIVQLSAGVEGQGTGQLEPVLLLDGFGRLSTPPATAMALDAGAERPAAGLIGPRHPPGFYGRPAARTVLNLHEDARLADLTRLPAPPAAIDETGLETQAETALKGWLLYAALLLAIVDMLIALWLRGLIQLPGGRAARWASALMLAALLGTVPGTTRADDDFALKVSNGTWLAWIKTGDPVVDQISQEGLEGLSLVLNLRTAVETEGAIGVDPNRDDLSFFPLIYWPLTTAQSPLEPRAVEALNAYLKTGGTILFDTRDQRYGASSADGSGPGAAVLRGLARGIDIPPLEAIGPEHVMTRSFYLLQEFPGRYAGGTLWVESDGAVARDGVSSVIITANDVAAAWAVDARGRPLYATVPGGERQREIARRFGVNLVMYVLTGNYKADQVHVPFILDRIGQ